MALNIAVCIKSVPDPNLYGNVRLDPVTKTVVRESVPAVVNPADLHAIELAMELKDSTGAKVTLFSMGPSGAAKQLREGLAYGADAAVLLSDRKFGGADSLATSYSLALGILKAGAFDLVITGDESSDGATTHIPSQLGEWLGYAHMTDVVGFELCDDGRAALRKKSGDEYLNYKAAFPLVIGVKKEINKVRTPIMKNIFAAKNKPFTTYTAEDFPDADEAFLGLKGSPTQNGELHAVSFGRQAREIAGSTEEQAAEIMRIIKPILGIR